MHDKILLSHGEGGKRTRDLIAKVIARYFDNPVLSPLFDSDFSARIEGEIAFTTDGYVVTPPFFPGGDIGRLAVLRDRERPRRLRGEGGGDLVRPDLEEGLPTEILERALARCGDAAREAGVTIACGTRKVCGARERGTGSSSPRRASASRWTAGARPVEIRPGDRILLTGTMGTTRWRC